MEGDLARVDGVERRPFELIDGDEPLLGQPRLQCGVATVAVHDGVIEVLDVIEQVVLDLPDTGTISVHVMDGLIDMDK